MKNDYCPFCHILVAPAASDRIERNGQAAHDSCVRRDKRSFEAARNLCSGFLMEHGGEFEARAFEIKFSKVTSTRDFGKLVGLVLRKYRARLDDPGKQAGVLRLADEIGDKLNIDIDVALDEGVKTVPTPPKARTNGRSRARKA